MEEMKMARLQISIYSYWPKVFLTKIFGLHKYSTLPKLMKTVLGESTIDGLRSIKDAVKHHGKGHPHNVPIIMP